MRHELRKGVCQVEDTLLGHDSSGEEEHYLAVSDAPLLSQTRARRSPAFRVEAVRIHAVVHDVHVPQTIEASLERRGHVGADRNLGIAVATDGGEVGRLQIDSLAV